MQIHTKIISIFSSTSSSSLQESKNFSSPDIIHISEPKELFLICLLLFSLRLHRPTPTPPAIIILTSLCFPGLIASRIQLIFCRRKSKFGSQTHTGISASRTNLVSPLSNTNSVYVHVEQVTPRNFTLTSGLLLPKATFYPKNHTF